METAEEFKDYVKNGLYVGCKDIKDIISCRLINAENNGDFLADKPHMILGEFAIVYTVNYLADTYMDITDKLLETCEKMYGITADNLHEIAMNNLAKGIPYFKSIQDSLEDIMEESGVKFLEKIEYPELYILSNQSKWHGAVHILEKTVMDNIAQKLGSNLIIIPSSIHEVLILPDESNEMTMEELEAMIQFVNTKEILPEEKLSDHAYLYDVKEHELKRMDGTDMDKEFYFKGSILEAETKEIEDERKDI